MKNSDKYSFQIMMVVMLAIYSLFFNIMQMGGALPSFDMLFYSNKSTPKTHYSLRFTEINSQQFDTAVYLDTPNEWLTDNERYEAMALVNQLGIAVYQEDGEKATELHQELVDTYFQQIESASYELVLRVVNPVEKYAMGNEPLRDQFVQQYRYERVLVTQ